MKKLLLLAALAVNSVCGAADVDRDGLDDDFEDALLKQFVPAFHVGPSDCDGAPAEFKAGAGQPRVVDRNGTIYGQAFKAGETIEVHYFHLWGSDCGRISHPLDAESVAVLLRPGTGGKWRAEYWFAHAHENTVCDRSHGAKASVLNAVDTGAHVWVSKDKHASFLSREFCAKGCGHDTCEDSSPLGIVKLVNVGELDWPRNGAVWTQSVAWPLARKMAPVFTEAAINRMREEELALIPVRGNVKGMQSTLKVASNTYGALETANQKTEQAITTSTGATGTALHTAVKHVGRSARVAFWSVKRAATRVLPSKP